MRSHPFFTMSSNVGSSFSGTVINWCQFIPLRGVTPVRHEAPSGKAYCLRHQGYVDRREETAERKRDEAEALLNLRKHRQDRERASRSRSRSYEKEALQQLSEDAEDDLSEASDSRPAKPVQPTISDLMAVLSNMTQLMAQMAISQQQQAFVQPAQYSEPAIAQPAVSSATSPATASAKGKKEGKASAK